MSKAWRWVAVAVVLAVAATGGTAYVVTRPSPHVATTAARPPVPRVPALAAITSGPATGAPTPGGVAAALAKPVASQALGGSLAGLVVDGSTGSTLFARESGVPMTPASTVKLLTAAAALTVLGPAARLSTTVARAGTTLYLHGGGDVTLLAKPAAATTYPMPADLAALAGRVATAVTDHGTKLRLCADVSAWTGPSSAPGWSPSYFRFGDVAPPSPLEVDEGRLSTKDSTRASDPVGEALTKFAAALRAAGVQATAPAGGCRERTPAGATAVGQVESPPVAALVDRMLTASDNDLAEALGRAVAVASGQPASFEGAAAAVTAAVTKLGVAPGELRLNDASGLSRLDRISAAGLVALLRAAIERPSLAPLLDGLPVAGATGTLHKRFRSALSAAGAGVVRAKTGTLAGVNSLAGVVVAADGRLLVFAFLTDRAASPTRAEAALDSLAAVLAGCGCS